jgi:hypothetical protein
MEPALSNLLTTLTLNVLAFAWITSEETK